MRVLLVFFVLLDFSICQKLKHQTAEQRLDDVIGMAFKLRDVNNDGIITADEIMEFYEKHPEKISKEGLDFIERTIFASSEKRQNFEEYRTTIKRWLAEKGSAARILEGLYGNHQNSGAK